MNEEWSIIANFALIFAIATYHAISRHITRYRDITRYIDIYRYISPSIDIIKEINTQKPQIIVKPAIATVLLLLVSNVFMTLAWYGHLKLQSSGISSNWPIWLVIVFSWGIALFEYCFMVPANRMGYVKNGGPYSLVQLKVMQEAITLVVFTIVAMFIFQGFTLRWNHVAAFLLLIAAVYLVFME